MSIKLLFWLCLVCLGAIIDDANVVEEHLVVQNKGFDLKCHTSNSYGEECGQMADISVLHKVIYTYSSEEPVTIAYQNKMGKEGRLFPKQRINAGEIILNTIDNPFLVNVSTLPSILLEIIDQLPAGGLAMSWSTGGLNDDFGNGIPTGLHFKAGVPTTIDELRQNGGLSKITPEMYEAYRLVLKQAGDVFGFPVLELSSEERIGLSMLRDIQEDPVSLVWGRVDSGKSIELYSGTDNYPYGTAVTALSRLLPCKGEGLSEIFSKYALDVASAYAMKVTLSSSHDSNGSSRTFNIEIDRIMRVDVSESLFGPRNDVTLNSLANHLAGLNLNDLFRRTCPPLLNRQFVHFIGEEKCLDELNPLNSSHWLGCSYNVTSLLRNKEKRDMSDHLEEINQNNSHENDLATIIGAHAIKKYKASPSSARNMNNMKVNVATDGDVRVRRYEHILERTLSSRMVWSFTNLTVDTVHIAFEDLLGPFLIPYRHTLAVSVKNEEGALLSTFLGREAIKNLGLHIHTSKKTALGKEQWRQSGLAPTKISWGFLMRKKSTIVIEIDVRKTPMNIFRNVQNIFKGEYMAPATVRVTRRGYPTHSVGNLWRRIDGPSDEAIVNANTPVSSLDGGWIRLYEYDIEFAFIGLTMAIAPLMLFVLQSTRWIYSTSLETMQRQRPLGIRILQGALNIIKKKLFNKKSKTE